MKRDQEPIEDLIVRGRRDELASDERRRLQVALGTSQESSLLHQAGAGFDQESSVLPGDDELVARIADRLAGATPLHPRRGMPVAWMVAGTVLALSTAAAAGWMVRERLAPAETPAVSVAASASGRIAAAPQRRSAAAPHPALSATATEPDQQVQAEGKTMVPRPVPRATLSGPDDLFARANRARRSGQPARAIQLYQQLEARYPRSAEAQQSNLTLAELYLQQGSPGAALVRFRHYRGGAMAAEALWGEARALRQLGRGVEERQVLQDLIQQFPRSAYAEAARQRLPHGSE